MITIIGKGRLFIVPLAVICLLMSRPAAAQATPSLVPLKVGVMNYLSYAPIFIAQEEGLFAKQGLAVDLIQANSASALIPALVRGRIDVLPAVLIPAIMNVIARGGDLKIVAARSYYSTQGCAYSGIMARRDLVESGRLKTARDLAGLRLSTERTASSYYQFDRLLAAGHLSFNDVKTTHLPTATELHAFSTAAIDVASSSEPWLTRMKRTGDAVLWARSSDLLPNFQYGQILYGPHLLIHDRDAGEHFLVAYLEAVRRLNAEGKSPRNLAILEKYTGLDEQTLQEACWPHDVLDGRVHSESLEQYQTWALRKKLIDRMLPLSQIYDPRFVESANRFLDQGP